MADSKLFVTKIYKDILFDAKDTYVITVTSFTETKTKTKQKKGSLNKELVEETIVDYQSSNRSILTEKRLNAVLGYLENSDYFKKLKFQLLAKQSSI